MPARRLLIEWSEDLTSVRLGSEGVSRDLARMVLAEALFRLERDLLAERLAAVAEDRRVAALVAQHLRGA